MTCRTDSKEREAYSCCNTWFESLPEGRKAVLRDDKWMLAHAAFEAGRASLAANAGSEPVAPPPLQHFESPRAKILMRAWQEGWDACRDAEYVGEDAQNDAFNQSSTVNHCVAEDILYTHPSPPEGMVGGWIALPGALPEPGTPVLLDIGKKYPIRAMWAQKFTLLVGLDDDSGFGEYDERTDEWYCPEGWYEWNEHEETHWAVSATPRAWAPLPTTSSADSRKGE